MPELFFQIQEIFRPPEIRTKIEDISCPFPGHIIFRNGTKIIFTTDSETNNPCAIVIKNGQEIHRCNLNDEIPITEPKLLNHQVQTLVLVLQPTHRLNQTSISSNTSK